MASITPRVDYSQGNDWDNELETLDDLHKPQLDGFGMKIFVKPLLCRLMMALILMAIIFFVSVVSGMIILRRVCLGRKKGRPLRCLLVLRRM